MATSTTTTHRRITIGVFAAFLLFSALLYTATVAQVADAKSTAVIHRAILKGSTAYPAVNGEAKWKSKEGERELEVQIEDATRLAGKRLAVRIGGTLVGHMRVSALGRARLVKSTQAGQSVPRSVLDKAVKIRTSAGVLVASGRF